MSGTKMASISGTAGRLAVVLALVAAIYVYTQRLVALSTATAGTLSAITDSAGQRRFAPRLPTDAETNRMQALSDRVEAIADNLANVHTQAFKRRRVDANTDLQTKVEDLQLDMSQGSLESTGINTDVAIQGEGFFKVKIPATTGDGIGYTRNGSLFQNMNGDLVAGIGDGYQLIPRINIPVGATDIEIAQDGTVAYTPKGGNTQATAGQITLTRFVNPQMLKVYRSGIFTQSTRSGLPIVSLPGEDGAGQILEGTLEASNVEPVKEWVALMKAEQSLQISSELLSAANKTLEMFVAMKQ